MWFSRAALIFCFALASCGFTPVYQTGQAATDLRNNISVEVIEGRYAFDFREHLQNRFGRASGSPDFHLTYTLLVSENALVISSTEEITRYSLSGNVAYRITDRRSGDVVFEDKVASNAAYSATAETFPTQVAERDANLRLVRDLADRIVTRLAITSKDWLK